MRLDYSDVLDDLLKPEFEKIKNLIVDGIASVRDWAWLYYHIILWHILPGYKGQKHPYLKWKEDGHAIERYTWDFLEKEFAKPNVTNILLVTGKVSNVTVVDDDSNKEEKQPISNRARFLLSELQPTPTSITGSGGKHRFYKFVKEFLDKIGIENCIDIRNGGLIVLPPSIHENGNKYEWENIYDLFN